MTDLRCKTCGHAAADHSEFGPELKKRQERGTTHQCDYCECKSLKTDG